MALEAIRSCFYIDDILTGCDNLADAKNLIVDLSEIFKEYGFHLRKWCSNNNMLLENIVEEDREVKWDPQCNQNIIKTLGLIWNSTTDAFQISTKRYVNVDQRKLTKRIIASESGSIFDPLGLVMPCVVVAKLILQELWQLKIDWDETLPEEISKKWLDFSA